MLYLSAPSQSAKIYIEQITNYITLSEGYKQIRTRLLKQINSIDPEDQESDETLVSNLLQEVRKNLLLDNSEQVSRTIDVFEDLVKYTEENVESIVCSKDFCVTLETVICSRSYSLFNRALREQNKVRLSSIVLHFYEKFKGQLGDRYFHVFELYKQYQFDYAFFRKLKQNKAPFPEKAFVSCSKENQFKPKKNTSYLKKSSQSSKSQQDLTTQAPIGVTFNSIRQFVQSAQTQYQQDKQSCLNTQFVRALKYKAKALFDISQNSQAGQITPKQKEQAKVLYKKIRMMLKQIEKQNEEKVKQKKIQAQKQFAIEKMQQLSPNKTSSPKKLKDNSKKVINLLNENDDQNAQDGQQKSLSDPQNPTNRNSMGSLSLSSLKQKKQQNSDSAQKQKLENPPAPGSASLLDDDDTTNVVAQPSSTSLNKKTYSQNSVDLLGQNSPQLIKKSESHQQTNFVDAKNIEKQMLIIINRSLKKNKIPTQSLFESDNDGDGNDQHQIQNDNKLSDLKKVTRSNDIQADLLGDENNENTLTSHSNHSNQSNNNNSMVKPVIYPTNNNFKQSPSSRMSINSCESDVQIRVSSSSKQGKGTVVSIKDNNQHKRDQVIGSSSPFTSNSPNNSMEFNNQDKFSRFEIVNRLVDPNSYGEIGGNGLDDIDFSSSSGDSDLKEAKKGIDGQDMFEGSQGKDLRQPYDTFATPQKKKKQSQRQINPSSADSKAFSKRMSHSQSYQQNNPASKQQLQANHNFGVLFDDREVKPVYYGSPIIEGKGSVGRSSIEANSQEDEERQIRLSPTSQKKFSYRFNPKEGEANISKAQSPQSSSIPNIFNSIGQSLNNKLTVVTQTSGLFVTGGNKARKISELEESDQEDNSPMFQQERNDEKKSIQHSKQKINKQSPPKSRRSEENEQNTEKEQQQFDEYQMEEGAGTMLEEEDLENDQNDTPALEDKKSNNDSPKSKKKIQVDNTKINALDDLLL